MKIFAVGMNYVEHNKELGNTLLITEKNLRKTEEPVIFTKPDSALLKDGKPFFIPDFMGRIDYEAEVVVRICRLGKGIPQQFAHRYYDAVTLGIDFTAREVQKKAKDLGRPWTIAKGFDGSAAIGKWVEMKRREEREERREEREERRENRLSVSHFPTRLAIYWTIGTLIIWAALYTFLVTCTDSRVPIADSFTTALSFVGIWALARKYLEQWLIWIAVDIVTCALYFYKNIPFKASLYALYVIIAIMGYWKWKRMMKGRVEG